MFSKLVQRSRAKLSAATRYFDSRTLRHNVYEALVRQRKASGIFLSDQHILLLGIPSMIDCWKVRKQAVLLDIGK